jgi:hypothetical protein
LDNEEFSGLIKEKIINKIKNPSTIIKDESEI